MQTTLFGFLTALVIGTLAAWGMQPVARFFGVVDHPDGFRKIHTRDTPRLGGVAVYLAFIVPAAGVLVLFPQHPITVALHDDPLRLFGLIGIGAAVLFLGAVDDAMDLRARWKFAFQLAVATLAYVYGFAITGVTIPLFGSMQLGLLSFPVTLFWFLGCMNAINLMDGLDGLAAGLSLFVTLTLMLVSLYFHNVATMFLLACLSGAILGFLFHNFHPARIFLGDSGSLLLGFMIAALSLMGLSFKSQTAVALLIPVVALGLPILDTGAAILRRWVRRLPISTADRRHIHHVLLSLGLSHRNTVLTLYVACIVLGGAALAVTVGGNETILLVLGALGIIAFICVRVLGGIRFDELIGRVSADWEQRQTSSNARLVVEKTLFRLEAATTLDELWSICCDAFERLHFDCITLSLDAGDSANGTFLSWTRAAAPPPSEHLELAADMWALSLELKAGGRAVGELRLSRRLREHTVAQALPEHLARLRVGLGQHLNRISEDAG